ncbi:MAG TPA: hypothetical protein VGG65_04350 [Thermoanaerobaculia bacterium]|jgi:hypothetical protein
MIAQVRTVNAILEQLSSSRPARKMDLGPGDYVVVTTENSVYSLEVLDAATFSVRGGWFDRQGLSPVRTSIAGCTWGGSVIKNDIVAACGLHLEFGNRLLTSCIREVLVIRAGGLRPLHSLELFSRCYGNRWESVWAN